MTKKIHPFVQHVNKKREPVYGLHRKDSVKVVGDTIYYGGVKVAEITVKATTIRDKFVEAII